MRPSWALPAGPWAARSPALTCGIAVGSVRCSQCRGWWPSPVTGPQSVFQPMGRRGRVLPCGCGQEHGRVAMCQQAFPYREGCRGPCRARPPSGRGSAELTVGAGEDGVPPIASIAVLLCQPWSCTLSELLPASLLPGFYRNYTWASRRSRDSPRCHSFRAVLHSVPANPCRTLCPVPRVRV